MRSALSPLAFSVWLSLLVVASGLRSLGGSPPRWMAAEADFQSILESVGQPQAADNLITDATVWFQCAGIASGVTLHGVTNGDLDSLSGSKWLPGDLALRAFIRRSCEAASTVALIKRRRLTDAQASPPIAPGAGPGQGSSLAGAVGSQSTSLSLLVAAISSPPSGCDIAKLCKVAGIVGWPSDLAADRAL
jgi:hypothetical protein